MLFDSEKSSFLIEIAKLIEKNIEFQVQELEERVEPRVQRPQPQSNHHQGDRPVVERHKNRPRPPIQNLSR